MASGRKAKAQGLMRFIILWQCPRQSIQIIETLEVHQ
jgi:hypothetical protein